jgi:hypothetical protein
MSLAGILSWACALLQSASSLEPPLRRRTLSGPVGRCGSSHEVCSPSASPRSQQQLDGRACLTRPLASSGFLDLSTPFDPPRACRPCFMPDPLMGLRPSELYSHRVAVRRLRRRSPRGVGPRSSPSLRPAPAHAREGRSLLGPGRPLSFHPSRSPGRPNPLPPTPPVPKHRRAERSPDPREPKLLRDGRWLYSPGPKPLRAERSPDPRKPKLPRAEPRPPSGARRPFRVGRPSTSREPKPLRAERPSEFATAEALPNRTPARSAGAEAPPDETSCPPHPAPKSRVARTSARSSQARRHPMTEPFARLSGTREPQLVRAIPLAPRRGRSPAGNPEAAAQRARNRSSVCTRRAFRSSGARGLLRLGRPRLPRPDPKAEPLPACSPPRSTGNRSHDEARRPSRVRRDPKIPPVSIGLPVPRGSEDPVGFRRGPKTSLDSAEVRRPRRTGQVVRPRQAPKTLPVADTGCFSRNTRRCLV